MHTAQRVELAAGRLDGLPDNDIAVAVKGVVSSERVNPKRGGSLTSFLLRNIALLISYVLVHKHCPPVGID